MHTSQKKFAPTDVIRMRGNSYTAAHKWESDALKIENLRWLDYTVLVIWESDNLDQKKKELYQLLGIQ